MFQPTMIGGVALVAASVATTGEIVTLMSGADRLAFDAALTEPVPSAALFATEVSHSERFCTIEALASSLGDHCEAMRTAVMR